MTVKTLLDILFGRTLKSSNLRNKAEEFVYLLRDKSYVSVEEARKFIGAKKSYYKILKKLKEVGLVSLTKDVDGKFNLSLSIDAYKFFVRKQLIEEVESVLKK